jgi:hypothetical protein
VSKWGAGFGAVKISGDAGTKMWCGGSGEGVTGVGGARFVR